MYRIMEISKVKNKFYIENEVLKMRKIRYKTLIEIPLIWENMKLIPESEWDDDTKYMSFHNLQIRCFLLTSLKRDIENNVLSDPLNIYDCEGFLKSDILKYCDELSNMIQLFKGYDIEICDNNITYATKDLFPILPINFDEKFFNNFCERGDKILRHFCSSEELDM